MGFIVECCHQATIFRVAAASDKTVVNRRLYSFTPAPVPKTNTARLGGVEIFPVSMAVPAVGLTG
jgi:hypothetical protein